MSDESDAFYVVRKGDIIGIYRSFDDCKAQAGFSPLDPSVSVYKGYGLSKEAESYLNSHGLKQAGFSISASDVHEELFGPLSVCPFQDVVGPSSFSGNPLQKPLNLGNYVEPQASVLPAHVPISASSERIPMHVGAGLHSFSTSQQKHVELKNYMQPQALVHAVHVSAESSSPQGNSFKKPIELTNYITPRQQAHPSGKSCTIEFDGASKQNPGPAGAGAILYTADGSEVWRLREGVGIATNNVAEYRAVILGLKVALQKGFTHIRVRGDSQLVCFQILGKWKTKNENMAKLCKEAKELTNKFLSCSIDHVAREFNSAADVQANRAIHLRDGQVEIEFAGSHA